MYCNFQWPSIIWEGMIIARDLDSESTKASDEHGGSVLSWPSLRPEETDKAVMSSPKNAPPKTSSRGPVIISMVKGMKGKGKGELVWIWKSQRS
jgi:hypothetical protein